MNDRTKTVTANDFSDLAHVEAVPYVDAITMDRRTADLCRRVSKRLSRDHPRIGYEERIFPSLKELLDSKPGSLARPPM